MRGKISNGLWGLFFILIGLGFAGNALFGWNFNLFFDGWWTLFIIIPCTISMIQNGPNTGSIIGLGIGVMLLLGSNDFFNMAVAAKLVFPFILIVIGVSIIFSGRFNRHRRIESFTNYSAPEYNATFSGQKLNFDNQPFNGTTLNAVFGGLELRLDHAIITEDTVVNCSAIFGGIDIYVPTDINVKVSSTPIFGGVSNKHRNVDLHDAPTLYVNATCMFGGVDIR
jgi:Predicted membrane protein (DUF2154).